MGCVCASVCCLVCTYGMKQHIHSSIYQTRGRTSSNRRTASKPTKNQRRGVRVYTSRRSTEFLICVCERVCVCGCIVVDDHHHYHHHHHHHHHHLWRRRRSFSSTPPRRQCRRFIHLQAIPYTPSGTRKFTRPFRCARARACVCDAQSHESKHESVTHVARLRTVFHALVFVCVDMSRRASATTTTTTKMRRVWSVGLARRFGRRLVLRCSQLAHHSRTGRLPRHNINLCSNSRAGTRRRRRRRRRRQRRVPLSVSVSVRRLHVGWFEPYATIRTGSRVCPYVWFCSFAYSVREEFRDIVIVV